LDIGQNRHDGFSREVLQGPDSRFAEVLRAVALPRVVPARMLGDQARGEALFDDLLKSRDRSLNFRLRRRCRI
jgi:hypothetical protein